MKRVCCFLLFIVFSLSLEAQVYPVQLSVQLTPPYSGYLQDYADPTSEKLRIFIQLNDYSQAQAVVKLRLEIKGNGFTVLSKQLFSGPPVTLFPGQPVLLTGSDLAPYLNLNNLDFVGLNKSQYEQKKVLPEGYYSICIKAFDFYSGSLIRVSNEGCAQAWFTQSNPPLLNFPQCNTTVNPLTPQNILFQWSAMHLGSPNSSFNTEYEFALWECLPDTSVNPNQYVLSAAPIFSTLTHQTFYNYGIADVPLNLYTKYVWRVRVRDISGRDLFKNNGWSETCVFRYGSVAQILGNSLNLTLYANAINHRAGTCSWNKQSVFTGYLLQVRKQGTVNWFDYPNTSGAERVANLQPNTVYECRVRGEGNGLTGSWSNVATFKTGTAPVYSCNDQSGSLLTNTSVPLAASKAKPGMIFQSGQFEIHTTQIQSSQQPGWFSGRGYAMVLNRKVKVFWNSVYIDENQVHQSGIIEAYTKGIDKWLSQWDLFEAEENATYVDSEIDSVYTNGSQICYSSNGNATCVSPPANQNVMVIRDGEGNQWNVNLNPPPPKVSGPSEYLAFSKDSLSANDSCKVVFVQSPTQNFGFDKKQYAAFIKQYEVIKLGDSTNYFVPNKSVGTGGNDEVYAQLLMPNPNAALLSFKNKAGSVLAVSTTTLPNLYKITGISSADGCVYALYDGKRIGKLNVHALKPVVKNLVLVPVNGTALPQNIALGLNEVYKQANVTWSVIVAPSFSFDLKDGKLESAEAGILNKYSEEMKELRDAYREKDTAYDQEAIYVFVVPQFTDEGQIGYMARGKALGFIRSTADIKSVAHELGHGAFALSHTFPSIAQSSCNNLMDYGNGTHLILEQWLKASEKPANFNWFDSEDEGSMFGNDRSAESAFTWLTSIKAAYKKGTSITVPSGSKHCSVGATCRELIGKARNCYVGGIQYDYIEVYIDPYKFPKTATPRNGITSVKYNTGYGSADKTEIIIEDYKFMIRVPESRTANMLLYLKDTLMYKNLMVFCNGYRPIVNFDDGKLVHSSTEFADTDNQCENGDCRGYWKGIDQKFMNAVGDRYAVYFDGHHSVGTSNHKNVANYIAANALSDYIRSSVKFNAELANLTKLNHGAEFLHTTSNTDGFYKRVASGEQAARNLIARINAGTVIFNKTTGLIDVVAHSMGYAYSVGLIRELKKNGFNFGRYYILAPENASAGGVNLSWFEEVWQYGSNLGEPNEDFPWLQDGVAPQCKVKNIDNIVSPTIGGRVFIPTSVDTKSFLGSHSVGNYSWIFTLPNTKGSGYVKKRN